MLFRSERFVKDNEFGLIWVDCETIPEKPFGYLCEAGDCLGSGSVVSGTGGSDGAIIHIGIEALEDQVLLVI